MARPKITILVLTYERPRLLRMLVQSIKTQTLKNFECIVLEDGGTPTAAGVLEVDGDERFRLVRNHAYTPDEKRSVCTPGALYNAGLWLAAGEYVSVCGNGATYFPDRCENLVRYLDAHRSCDLVWGHQNQMHYDEHGALLRAVSMPPEPAHIEIHNGTEFYTRLCAGNFIDACSVVERTNLARQWAWSDAPEDWRTMDWERWKDIAQLGYSFNFIALPGETKHIGPWNLGRRLAGGEPIESVVSKYDDAPQAVYDRWIARAT